MNAGVILAVPLLVALLQAPGLPAEPAATVSSSNAYRVGPGDVLEVRVEGRPDISRLPTVQTTGAVFLPRAGELKVAGLTTGEIAALIEPRIAGEDLPSPRVSVTVKEYQSQFVWVRGEVVRPGRKPLRSGTRLIDALLDAGGFTAQASGEVTIHRQKGTFPDGSQSLLLRFGGENPSPEELEKLGLRLANGDLIVATTQHWVSVRGEVGRPGHYPLDETSTLSGLIEAAGGLTRFASNTVIVRRRDPAAAGGSRDIEADLKAIGSGEVEDLVLEPGDQVAVMPRRL